MFRHTRDFYLRKTEKRKINRYLCEVGEVDVLSSPTVLVTSRTKAIHTTDDISANSLNMFLWFHVKHISGPEQRCWRHHCTHKTCKSYTSFNIIKLKNNKTTWLAKKKKITVPIFSKLCCLGCHGDFLPHHMIQAWNILLTEVQTLHAASVQELLHMLENLLMFNGTKELRCEYFLFLLSNILSLC